jgi:carboxyl-terminal processing protease
MSGTDDGTIVVTLIRDGSPAASAGIKLGAVITEWGGKPISEAAKTVVLQSSNASTPAPLLDAKLRDLTRGPLGSKVSVTFQNPGETPKTVELTRDAPKAAQGVQRDAPQVKDNKLPSGIGYVKIDNFTSGGGLPRFDGVVDQLIKDNVPAIIIDIRSNPGGLSQLADAMASRFFDKPATISQMYTKDGRYAYVSLVDPRQPVYNGCVAVLVDMFTASSGDMFAYTFKSTKRGQIVGQTPSYGGGGTVSGGMYRLPDGAQIQVPTGGSYDTQHNIVVEGQGVAPDVKVPLTAESLLSPKDTVLDAAVQAMTTCGKKQ